jgi:hypothetical protein
MKLILTSDLHQWIPKWTDLVGLVRRERPRFVLVAGDLLPKEGGHSRQALNWIVRSCTAATQ